LTPKKLGKVLGEYGIHSEVQRVEEHLSDKRKPINGYWSEGIEKAVLQYREEEQQREQEKEEI
jgi:hypothetical protein